MDEVNLHDLGAYELMQVLHELHGMGYQRLRWMSYMSPNGGALRCHITIQDNLCGNSEIIEFNPEMCFSTSVGKMTTGHDIKPYLELFVRKYAALLRRGKGSDEEYVRWFDGLLRQAAKGETPVYYGEFWDLPLGMIRVGNGTYPAPPMTMRIVSWNIDGVKAHFDDLKKLVAQYSPEIICLQKVKDVKCSKEFEIEGYVRMCNAGPYSGVVTYSKCCIPCDHTLVDEESSFAGHLVQTHVYYPNLTLFNVYTPYSNPKIDGAIDARVRFDRALQRAVSHTPDRMIICGDMNVVHTEWDCWDRKHQRNQANFHDWEREGFERLLGLGNLIDTYRVFNRFTLGYTYFFRNDKSVREANHGHRIDYFLCSRSLEPQLTRSEIIKEFTSSPNNPILLEFKY